MSGHSKWSTIKRQKGAADIKRGQMFTKVGNAITIAIREGGGGDPESNFKLRLAIEQAKTINMPKENIQRAVDRGLGKAGAGGQLESVVYEGYGPGKVAIIVEATTDNKNRTTSEVKNVIEKNGGIFASPGAVSWMFAEQGLITIPKNGKTIDDIFILAADAGADDVEDSGEVVEVTTRPASLENVRNELASKGLAIETAEISKKPTTIVEIKNQDVARKILALLEKLEDLDDVQKVYSNFDIDENLFESIQGS